MRPGIELTSFPQFPEHAEADTFFCFTALMAEIGDLFTKKLDSAHLGIGTAVVNLTTERINFRVVCSTIH